MEDSKTWYQTARKLLPEKFKNYVEIIYSPPVEDYYALFRGVRYKNIPERPYEFVFIDGPRTKSPRDEIKTFNLDFISVVSKSDRPVFGILDLRLTTYFVLREVLGPSKVSFSKVRSLGFIGPCSKNDLMLTNEIVLQHENEF